MSETITITGRQRVSLLKKLNPIWWFGNDFEQQLPAWYEGTQPQWLRNLNWALRNPLQNLRAVVIGVEDKNYTVTGRAPVMTVQRNDLVPAQDGWQWCVLYSGDLWVPRAFASYCGKHLVVYFGWQPSGFFGVKLNLR